MTKEYIVELYTNAEMTNYDVEFTHEQMQQLEEIHMHKSTESSAERMYLRIICSALKYYINTSPEGFQDNILDIVQNLERIYNINELLDDIIEIE